MKRSRRILIMLVAFMLMATALFANAKSIHAATDISGARSISTNTTYTGKIEDGSDYEKDYYKFTLPQSGYVTVTFTNSSPSSSTNSAWTVDLLTNYAAETITSKTVRLNNSSVSLTTIGLTAGTYYIRIQSCGWGNAISTSEYSIKANYTQTNYWETEFNETTGTANMINTNTAYYGTIRNGSDYEKDYYRFTTKKDGYITIDFTNLNPVSTSDSAWTVTLYGFSSDALAEIGSRTIKTNNNKVSMTTMGLAAGTYYIRIQSSNWSSAISTNQYSIKVNYTESNYWEKEFNEKIETANVINTNTTYHGTIRNGSDYEKDYYRFTTKKDGYITVDFTNLNPISSSNSAWTVTLYGFKSDALTGIDSWTIKTNNNKVSMTTMGLAAGTYYVCVQSSNWSSAISTNQYSLKVNYTESDFWEKEFNETTGTATEILTRQKYSGTVRDGYDYEKDYYKFTTTDYGTIKIKFYNDVQSTSTSKCWDLIVYDDALNKLGAVTIKLNQSYDYIVLEDMEAGTYYIRVDSYNGYDAVSKTPYKLKVAGAGIPIAMNVPDGWFNDDGEWYYIVDGVEQTGWVYVDGKWYYMDTDGTMQTWWNLIDDAWYYMDDSGAMRTGWMNYLGYWFYFKSSGEQAIGWQKIDGIWYYFNDYGGLYSEMVTGWKQIGGVWYYFDASGAMKTGWLQQGSAWYYFKSSGAMVTGWQQIGGVWYYFGANGLMQTGWRQIGGAWYYFRSSGAMQTGWLKAGNIWYYFHSSGAMATGSVKLGGKLYRFNAAGVCLNP